MGRSKEFEEIAVIQKAMELFWKQGYEKTSMNDLVEHMGIHRKSIYDTFGDKHTLFLKVLEHYSNQSAAKLQFEVDKATSSLEALHNIFRYMMEENEEKHYGCMFVNSATEFGVWDSKILDKVEDAFQETEVFISEIIKQGQQRGEFSKKQDSDLLAEVLNNTLIGLRVMVKTSDSKEKMKRITDFFLKQLIE